MKKMRMSSRQSALLVDVAVQCLRGMEDGYRLYLTAINAGWHQNDATSLRALWGKGLAERVHEGQYDTRVTHDGLVYVYEHLRIEAEQALYEKGAGHQPAERWRWAFGGADTQ